MEWVQLGQLGIGSRLTRDWVCGSRYFTDMFFLLESN